MAELSELESGKLQALFDHFDSDSDGLITADDLKTLFAETGRELDDEQADALIARADPEGTGSVDFERFAASIILRGAIRRRLLVLLAIFREMDTDGTGMVTADNLKEIAAQSEAEIEDEQIDAIIAALDQTGDGEISFKEFLGGIIAHLKEKYGEEDEEE